MLGRIDQKDLQDFKNMFAKNLTAQQQVFFDTNIPLLQKIWSQVVGKEMAVHTLPFKISKKVLYVRADHPIYLQQLQFYKAHVLQKLSNQYNIHLKNIHSHVGTIYWPLNSPPAPPANKNNENKDQNTKRKDALSNQNSMTQDGEQSEKDKLWEQLISMLRNFQE